ncbi:MAG: orotate phosphoribosyltransferase [Herminiimonas sp.]|nr:orotate phosphoribosyltransferase [Herminiimonas sp.]
MDKQSLGRQLINVAELRGDFLLRSGVRSTKYFDKYQFESDPQLLHEISQHLQLMVPIGTEILAGLELGGIPLAVMLGQLTRIPVTFVRKKAKDYGTCRLAEGPAMQGKQVVFVEDVVTSGGAVRDAAIALRADGVSVAHVLCVIEREGQGRELLRQDGLELFALFSQAELDRLPRD